MATLVVSDLHIGASGQVDLLRRPEILAALTDRLRAGDIERLVILGDGLEMREGPVLGAVDAAEPLFAELGAALGSDGEILLTAGNHDHNLLAGWVEQHLQQDQPMGVAEPIEPSVAGPLAQRLAAAAAPARLGISYPGVWLRDDVYGIHGHYLDVHTPVPTIERIVAGAMARAFAPLPDGHLEPDDYEAVLAPMYAWMFALAQRSNVSAGQAGARGSVAVWRLLAGDGRREHPVRATALLGGLRAGTALLNRAGVGPLRAELSGGALRRGSLEGMGEAIARLDIRAPYVIFGHTHRSGPWPGDDESEWTTRTGARLVNTGSWVYQPHFLPERAGTGPYWPGTAVRIDDDGPPVLERLLSDRSHDELRPPRAPA